MAERREINSWVALPPRYRKAYLVLAHSYRKSRLYPNDTEADRDAFQQMRDQYWRQARKAVRCEGRDQLGLLDATDNAESSD